MNNCSDTSINYHDVYTNETFEYYPTIKLPVHMVVIYGIAYSFIFISALIGNTMVVVVVVRTPRMHTVTNLFITSLAVSDILVAIFCIPITFLDNIYSGWPFTAFLCKMVPYIQSVCVCASVYNLAAIAADRYLAICFHPRWRIMKRAAVAILSLIWIFSLTLQIPWAVYHQEFAQVTTSQTIYLCGGLWPDFDSQRVFFVVAIFIGTYLLPLSFVFLCYILIARHVWQRQAPGVVVGRGMIQHCRKNVIKMLITVVLMFLLSWLPLHVLFLVFYFDPPSDNLVLQRINDIGIPLAQVLGLSNSGMNAFIYSFFSVNFRRGFAHLCYCILPNRKSIRGASSSQKTTRSLSGDILLSRHISDQKSYSSRVNAFESPVLNLTSRHINNKSYLKNVLHASMACAPDLSSEKNDSFL